MKSGPDITVDGLTFELQSIGGISQIYRECLPRLCEIGAQITVCTASDLQGPVPHHSRLTHLTLGPYGRIIKPAGTSLVLSEPLRRVLFKAPLRKRSRSIWHSTYYTLPPPRWEGPNVVLVADMIYEMFPEIMSSTSARLFRKQKERCISTADVIVCISQTTKQDVLRLFDLPETQVHAIHLAASEAYRLNGESRQDESEAPFFLYVGGRSAYKNFSTVLDAWEIWCPKTNVKLAVVGPPFSSDESQSLSDRGLTAKVRHTGRPNEPDLADLYKQARGFIYPSLYEGFGIPLVEAMSCGCPIIASDIPSSREIAEGCATYFDPSDASSLVAALDTVLESPTTSIECGLRRARDFSWDKTARELYGIFAEL